MRSRPEHELVKLPQTLARFPRSPRFFPPAATILLLSNHLIEVIGDHGTYRTAQIWTVRLFAALRQAHHGYDPAAELPFPAFLSTMRIST